MTIIVYMPNPNRSGEWEEPDETEIDSLGMTVKIFSARAKSYPHHFKPEIAVVNLRMHKESNASYV